jgi:hypothetical protein
MMARFSPELGQLLHGNPVGFDLPDFADALMVAIRSEIARVYWNVRQSGWRGAGEGDIGFMDAWVDAEKWEASTDDPGIPGIEWRPYYNWGGCPEDDDWDADLAARPNFSFEGVEIRWYKRFGRSMNANVNWPAEKWAAWFDRVMQTVRAFECQEGRLRLGKKKGYPLAEGRVLL